MVFVVISPTNSDPNSATTVIVIVSKVLFTSLRFIFLIYEVGVISCLKDWGD